jgi:hypothetical protein
LDLGWCPSDSSRSSEDGGFVVEYNQINMSVMRILLTLAFVLLSLSNLRAQSISHIETTKSWYYIYDQNGKKIKTLSTSQGELKGYSSTFYIIKQGSAFYVTYDVNGKRLHTFGAASVGETLAVSSDTFTSRQGVWK